MAYYPSEQRVSFQEETLDEEDTKCFWCKKITRYFLVIIITTSLYVLQVVSDVFAAINDYGTGHTVYAIWTLSLCYVPSLLFSVYMFLGTFKLYTGLFACLRGTVWLLLIPVMPLWPIIRACIQIVQGVVVICKGDRSMDFYRPTSAHLLKFLQAMTAAAPQLVLRLHKAASGDVQRPLRHMSGAEIAQIIIQLFVLSITTVTTYNKSVTIQEVQGNKLPLPKLSIGSMLLALVWWWSFLAARVPCIALFIVSLHYWTLLLFIFHFCLVFAMQTITKKQNAFRKFLTCLFSGFVFIFVYVQVNMKNRIQRTWVPYVLFSVLGLLEQSVMVGVWSLVRRGILVPVSPFQPSPTNGTALAGATVPFPDDGPYLGFIPDYDLLIIFIHYLLYAISALFMSFTICSTRSYQSNDDDEDDY